MTEKIAGEGNGQKRGQKTGMALLEEVLDAYGADRTRWPAQVRRELAALLPVSDEARRALADAEAFDRLLDMAPVLSAQTNAALAERIVAKSALTPRAAAAATLRARVPFVRRHAAAAAALAASLLAGVFAGQTQSVAPVVGDLVSAVEMNDTSNQHAVLSDEADNGVDEDLL